jgi:cytoskeletal protein CcmA (bactofilin family)
LLVFNRSPNSDPAGVKPAAAPGIVPGPAGQAAPAAAIVSQAPRPGSSPFDRAQSVSGTSVIGTDLTIMGEKITIISQNKLTIDGDIFGDVFGRQVVIGEEGSVIGTVAAESVEVRGGVRGAIRGQAVVLHPTSQVEGDITHQTLAISEGAHFDGRVRRAKDANELVPNLDVSAFEELRQKALPNT